MRPKACHMAAYLRSHNHNFYEVPLTAVPNIRFNQFGWIFYHLFSRQNIQLILAVAKHNRFEICFFKKNICQSHTFFCPNSHRQCNRWMSGISIQVTPFFPFFARDIARFTATVVFPSSDMALVTIRLFIPFSSAFFCHSRANRSEAFPKNCCISFPVKKYCFFTLRLFPCDFALTSRTCNTQIVFQSSSLRTVFLVDAYTNKKENTNYRPRNHTFATAL